MDAPQWSRSSSQLGRIEVAGRNYQGIRYSSSSSTAVLHVHGMGGNFYHNWFLTEIAAALCARNIDLVAFNLRSHDYLAESMVGDRPQFVGASIVTQAEADIDLISIVESLSREYDSIVLQGHSYGCDVIARNLTALRGINSVALLSPADAGQLQTVFESSNEEPALGGLDALGCSDGIRLDLVGIAVDNLRYPVPIVAGAAASFMEAGPGWFKTLSEYTGSQNNVDAFVYLGGRDPLLLKQEDEMKRFLRSRFRSVFICEPPDGDHHMTGIESTIADQIAEWVATRVPSDE